MDVDADESSRSRKKETTGQRDFATDDILILKGHSSEVFMCQWNPQLSLIASGYAGTIKSLGH